MKFLRAFTIVFLTAAGAAHAQAPGEIVFWETVRDSKNPAELRAYLQRFPNGMFAPIAEARIAALEKPAAAVPATRPGAVPTRAPAVASVAPSRVTVENRMPQAGDTWTYTLSYPHQFGRPSRPSSNYVVKIGSLSEGKIIDQISIDGGSVSDVTQSSQLSVAPQGGVSLFSPYLVAFRDLPQRGSIGSVANLDPACNGRYGCEAKARVLGEEAVQVPAGKFNAIKVAITQEWRGSGVSDPRVAAQMIGGRTVTVWYVPEIKRAVKVQSRLSAGDVPPVEPHFDLDLVSYKVK
jgi:hypothetical protein